MCRVWNVRPSLRAIAVAAAVLPLAACFNSGPSDADARAAYVAFPGGGNGDDVFVTFKIAACKEAVGAPGHQCDFTYNLNGSPTRTGSGRFFKAGDKWVFEQTPRGR